MDECEIEKVLEPPQKQGGRPGGRQHRKDTEAGKSIDTPWNTLERDVKGIESLVYAPSKAGDGDQMEVWMITTLAPMMRVEGKCT